MSEYYQIRISNLSWKAAEDDLKSYITTFAKVNTVKLIKDFRNRSKGYLKN